MTPIQDAGKFARTIFVMGVVFGLITAAGYAAFVSAVGDWDGTAIFHTVIILWGLGFMFPCFTVSLKLMFRTYDMSHRALENSEMIGKSIESTASKVEPIIDQVGDVALKVEPIVENVDEIVAKAKAISDDVTTIAHKAREVSEQVNGHFDLAKIEGELTSVRKSLETIASTFSWKKGAEAEKVEQIPTPF